MPMLTRDQMEQVIKEGGSIHYKNQIITNVADLPCETELVETPEDFDKLEEDLLREEAALEAKKRRLDRSRKAHAEKPSAAEVRAKQDAHNESERQRLTAEEEERKRQEAYQQEEAAQRAKQETDQQEADLRAKTEKARQEAAKQAEADKTKKTK